MSALGLAGAAVVGGAFGYASQRGAFCLSSGFRGVLQGEWTKVKALGLAVALQLVVLPAVFASGLARAPELPLPLLGALAGGLLFGVSMRWAGGCAAGVLYKVGAGDVGALLAVLGMALGASAAESGPLAGVRVALQQAIPNAASWRPPFLVSAATGFGLLAVLARRAPLRVGAWDWRVTGLAVGAASAVAWPAATLAGRDFGLAVVPGATGLVSATVGRPFPAWDLALVLGIAGGGWLAARRGRAARASAPTPTALIERFVGGIGLGVGASIAGGCTVGLGLTGLALLAPSSIVVVAAIFTGNALATLAAPHLEGGGFVRQTTARG